MALGSTLAHQMEKKDFEKKSKKRPKEVSQQPKEKDFTLEHVNQINRCADKVCQKCRKHASCILRPTPEGYCTSLEEGPAWDHTCKHKDIGDFDDFDY